MTVNISVSQSVLCLIDMGYDNECIPGFVDGFGLKIDHIITPCNDSSNISLRHSFLPTARDVYNGHTRHRPYDGVFLCPLCSHA